MSVDPADAYSEKAAALNEIHEFVVSKKVRPRQIGKQPSDARPLPRRKAKRDFTNNPRVSQHLSRTNAATQTFEPRTTSKKIDPDT